MLRYHGPLQVLRSTQNHFWTPRWKFKKEPLLVVYTDSGKDVARGHWSTWAFHLLAAFQRHTEAYMPFLPNMSLNKAGKQFRECYGRWRADTLCAYTGPWSLSSKYPHCCSCTEQSRIYHLSFTFVHSESIDCVADVFIPEMRIVWSGYCQICHLKIV